MTKSSRSIAGQRRRERRAAIKQSTLQNIGPKAPKNAKESGARAVGSTFELIEKILFELPAQRLFVLQMVNSGWQGVIQRSEKLKTKMWLMPASNRNEHGQSRDAWNQIICPFLAIDLSHFADSTPKKNETGLKAITAVVEEAFFSYHPHYPPPQPLEPHRSRIFLQLHFSSTNNTQDDSWQKIHVTQPPTTFICLTVEQSRWQNRGKWTKTIKSDDGDGFTFGDLYAKHEEFIRELAEQGVCVSSEHVKALMLMERAVKGCCKEHCWSSRQSNGKEDECHCFSFLEERERECGTMTPCLNGTK